MPKTSKNIIIGADHGGFELKESLKRYFRDKKIPFEDAGNYVLDENDDYPEFASRVAKNVRNSRSLGVLICRSGAGVSVVANKFQGIRAVNVHTTKEAQAAREDEDANVLCLGADYLSMNLVKKIVTQFINTKRSNAQRHKRRREQIGKIEKGLLA